MLSLIGVHDEARVNNAGDSAGKRQHEAQDKTEDPLRQKAFELLQRVNLHQGQTSRIIHALHNRGVVAWREISNNG